MADPIESTAKVVGSPGTAGALKKPVANVPIYVWGIVIVGALGYSFLRSKKAATTTADGTNTTAPSALVYTGDANGAGTTDTTSTATTSTYQTNDAWATAAKNYLIGQGSDPKAVSDAIDLYINAQALNAQQNAFVALALKAVGPTPQSLPPTTGSTGGTTTPTTDTGTVWGTTPRQNSASLVGTTYVVQPGDTLVSIARKAFGLSATDYSSAVFASNQILNANHSVIPDVSHLASGTSLYIPVLSSEEFPGFGSKVPQFGLAGKTGPFTQSTGEWQIDTGLVPESANAPRTGPGTAG